MIVDQTDAAPRVRCDAPDCPEEGQTEMGQTPRGEPTVGHLPDGWRAIAVLGETQHFCRSHAEKWL
jgi:hypothetical protein